jgi:CelD/BcsL family acetyltransferase involved in cellulose biosynthesis
MLQKTITHGVIMQIKVFRTFHEADALAEQWHNLLQCCIASHVPFLRYEYLKTWWETLGGGEWSQGELFILAASTEDGELAGIAPLFFTHNREHEPALMLLGSIEISDYLDFIVRIDRVEEFTRALLGYLAQVDDPAWRVLDMYNLPHTSPTLAALEHTAQKMGWKIEQTPLQPCPNIPLPGDYEQYLLQIDKKQRHEIRRKMRRAEEYEPKVHWYMVEDGAQLDKEVDDFLSLMAQDPEKERFLTPAMRRHMHAISRIAFKEGWLQLAFLEVGEQKAAGYLNFDFANHIWVYNSGLNFDFRDLSAGWVLLGYLLEWANKNGRESFDFMRGAEDYKYRFGGINRFVIRARIERA